MRPLPPQRSHAAPVLVAFLLAACAPGPAPGPRSPTATTPDAGSSSPSAAGLAPTWTLDEALGRVLDLAELPLSPPLIAAYLEALTWGDGACPGSDTQITIPVEGCYAEDGTWFEGSAFYREDVWEDGGGHWDVTELGGDFSIQQTNGVVFDGGGSAGDRYHTQDGVTEHISDVRGTFVDEAEAGPLGTGLSTFLVVTDVLDGDQLSLDGSVGFDGLYLDFAALVITSACASGRLSVRDPTGAWYDVDYGADCAACASSRFDGEDLGEVCPDLSGFVGTVRAGFLP